MSLAALAAVAIAAVGVGSGPWNQAAPPSLPARAADFTAPVPTYEFGTVVSGVDVQHVFELSNPGDTVLKIKTVRATCGCTVTDGWEREVPAGGTWTLPVTLKTARLHGDVRKEIVVHVGRAVPAATKTAGETRPTEIRFALAGHVQPHFDFSPNRNLIFAWTNKAKPTERKITITNLLVGWASPTESSGIAAGGTRPTFAITKAAVNNSAFEVTLNELEPGRRYEIVAKLTADLGKKERQSGRVTLTTTSPHQPEITLPIAAFRVPTVARARPAERNAAGKTRPTHGGDGRGGGKGDGDNRSRDCEPDDPLTYGGPGVQVEYDLLADHQWYVPVMGALARDPERPANDPLPWVSGSLGWYVGNFTWDQGYFYQARYQLPHGLSLTAPPYSGPIPPAAVRVIKFAGLNCVCANRDPGTPLPPERSAAQAAADAYCAGMCGDGFTMTDFDMNQWNLTCYNHNGNSYKVVSWGGTRCGKVQGQTIIECDPQTKLTQVRQHLWQNPLEECPECDLDGDGVISMVDVILARNTGFVPRHRGVGLTYALLFPTGTTIDQTLDPSPFVGSDVQIIVATYFDITEWDSDFPGSYPVDCNEDPMIQADNLSDITLPGGINGSLADSWCAIYGPPGATQCEVDSQGYQIGHCRVWPDGTHSIRVTMGYCMRCN